MTVKDKFNTIVREFVVLANKAILNRNFKKLEETNYVVRIEVLGEIIEVWNVDEQPVQVWRIIDKNCEFMIAEEVGILDKPTICRDILRGHTEQEIVSINSDIDKQIEILNSKRI